MQQRQDDIKRLHTSGPASDNLDGTRKDTAADGDNPVGRFIDQRREAALRQKETRQFASLVAALKARRSAEVITGDEFHDELLSFTSSHLFKGQCLVKLFIGSNATPEGAAALRIAESDRRERAEQAVEERMQVQRTPRL